MMAILLILALSIKCMDIILAITPRSLSIYNAGDIVIPNREFRRVTEPFKIFEVPEDASEDERKNLKFAVTNIPCYDPLAGYAYYEFTKRAFILPERNVMALKKVCIMTDIMLNHNLKNLGHLYESLI